MSTKILRGTARNMMQNELLQIIVQKNAMGEKREIKINVEGAWGRVCSGPLPIHASPA